MSNNADHDVLGSAALASREVAAKSHKFAEGYARVREVTDLDGACPAWAKALFMSCAAAVRGHEELMLRELGRSKNLGLSLNDARGAALTVFISRGEGVYSKFTSAINELYARKSESLMKNLQHFNWIKTLAWNILKVILASYQRTFSLWPKKLLEPLRGMGL